jgi:hypothetical protein
MLIIGMPTFPGGMAWVRRHIIPLIDTLLGKDRGHAQVFTTDSLRKLIDSQLCVRSQQARGFRITSGGLLGFLENSQGWYRLNRRVGARFPSLCIQTQVLVIKQGLN